MSANCVTRPFFEGHAFFSHVHCAKGLRPGHWLMRKALQRSSMACVMFSWPPRPFSSSMSVRPISPMSTFMRRHSWSAQTM